MWVRNFARGRGFTAIRNCAWRHAPRVSFCRSSRRRLCRRWWLALRDRVCDLAEYSRCVLPIEGRSLLAVADAVAPQAVKVARRRSNRCASRCRRRFLRGSCQGMRPAGSGAVINCAPMRTKNRCILLAVRPRSVAAGSAAVRQKSSLSSWPSPEQPVTHPNLEGAPLRERRRSKAIDLSARLPSRRAVVDRRARQPPGLQLDSDDLSAPFDKYWARPCGSRGSMVTAGDYLAASPDENTSAGERRHSRGAIAS